MLASSPRTTSAKVLSNPSGAVHTSPAAAYASRTRASTRSGSLSGACFNTAVSAVPVYST